MFGLSLIDLLVIVLYFCVLIGLGFRALKQIRDREDFFVGGRRFGRIFQMFLSFGQATSSEDAVGTVTNTYRDGAGGTWSSLILLWATPFYWFTARWYRRMRLVTMGDFFRERYGSRRLAMVYSTLASFYMAVMIAVALKAVSVTVMGMTLKTEADLTPAEQSQRASALRMDELATRSATAGITPAETTELRSLQLQAPRREFSHVNEDILVWVVVAIVLLYGLVGGMVGAVWSEAVQSLLIVVMSFLLIPFAIIKLTTLHGVDFTGFGEIMRRELPSYFFSPFGSAVSADFTWYFILTLSLMATLNVAVQANQLTANASARDEMAAAVGFTSGTMLKRYLTVIWGFIALLCFALYGRQISNSDLVWGHATRDLLGGLGLGLVGLMIACLLAALQSTATTMMLSASGLLTNNVYMPLFPGRGEAHYLKVGRWAGALFLIPGAVLTTSFDTVFEMLKFLWEFNAVVAASFWCGLKWRRATRQGAWSSITVAMLVFMILPFLLPAIMPGMRTDPALQRQTEQRVIMHTSAATPRDVEERAQRIAAWSGDPAGAPAPLAPGDTIERPLIIRPRSLYWAQGLQTVAGEISGRGLFRVETWALDQFADLTRYPYAVNETLRYLVKILLPFLVLIIVSWLTPAPNSPEVTRFFLRMRTVVRRDRAEDARAVEYAYAHPESTEAGRLLPGTNLEFFKWNRRDLVGFIIAFIAVFGVVGLLYTLLSLGR